MFEGLVVNGISSSFMSMVILKFRQSIVDDLSTEKRTVQKELISQTKVTTD